MARPRAHPVRRISKRVAGIPPSTRRWVPVSSWQLVALVAIVLAVWFGRATWSQLTSLRENAETTENLVNANIRTVAMAQRELLRLNSLLEADDPEPEALELQRGLVGQRMTEVSSPYQIQTLQSEELLAETRAISAVWKTDLRPLLLQIETEPDRYPEQRLQARAIASELERRLNEVLTLSEQRRRELSAETNRVVKGLIGGTGQLLVGFATVVTLMALLAGLAIRNLMRSEREKDQDRRKLEDLNAQLLKYSDVALLTEDLVIIADADSRIEWVNPAFERQTGYTLAEARGRTTSELLHGPDTDPEMARFIEERIAEGHGFKLQILNYSKDQMPYWVDADVRPVTDPDGTLRGFVGVETEVTQQVETQQHLEAARQAAEETARAKTDFLATMSHEIRTPLNAVVGLTDLLLDTQLDPQQQEYASVARSSGQLLLTVVNNILDFSALDAGAVTLDNQPFALRESLHAVIDMFAPEAQRKEVDLSLSVAADLPTALVGDGGRLQQILVNLVGNAVKFTDSGSVQIAASVGGPVPPSSHAADSGMDPTGSSVVVSYAPVDAVTSPGRDDEADTGTYSANSQWVEFSVSDTGIGIASNRAKDLFDPFAQEDSSTSRRFGGTGLGLSIARSLVLLMGGWLELTSDPGRGTKVTVALPLPSAPASAVPASLPGLGADATPTSFEGLRTLVTDDDPTSQQVAVHMLRRLGIETDVASDGAACLEATRSVSYDVIFMDIHMPDMDGLATTAAILARHPNPDDRPRIIAMTANALDGDRERFLAAGMDAYVAKPVRLDAIESAIRSVLPASGATGPMPELKQRLGADRHIESSRRPLGATRSTGAPVRAADPVAAMDQQPGAASSVGADDVMLEPFSYEGFCQMFGQPDEALFAEVVDTFLEVSGRVMDDLDAAVRRGDLVATASLAHQLSGSSAACHALALRSVAQDIEVRARGGQPIDGETLNNLWRQWNRCLTWRTASIT